MRFSLLDLLLVIACCILGCSAAASVARLLGYGLLSEIRLQLCGFPLGVLFYLVLTPPIYRRFSLLPLFLPKCPHCGVRPNGYRIEESRWASVVAVCAHCQKTTELWWRQPTMADTSKTMRPVWF